VTTVVSAPVRTFREATATDVPRLAEMFERFRAEGPYAAYGPAQPEVSTALIELLITHEDGVILVTARDDRLVGMLGVMVSAHPWTGERMATELFWWLEPEYRGDGAWLLRRAEHWAEGKRAVRLLMVSPQNPTVDRIYEALGYAPVETSWQKSLQWFDRHAPRECARLYPHGIVVHDDVLPDPMAYRAMALQQRFQAVQDGAVTFQRMAPCADPVLPMWIVRHYPQLTPTLSFFRQGEQDQTEPHYIHTDASMGDWTAILYLNSEPPPEDGTAFWKHRETGQVRSREVSAQEAATWFDDAWELWRVVEAKFNRLVLFPAPLYHSRTMRQNYGHGDNARLIQVCFGTGRLP